MSSLTLGEKLEKSGEKRGEKRKEKRGEKNLRRKGSPVVGEPRGAFNLVLAVGLRKNYDLKLFCLLNHNKLASLEAALVHKLRPTDPPIHPTKFKNTFIAKTFALPLKRLLLRLSPASPSH